ESEESTPNYPTLPDNTEEQGEVSKGKEEDEKIPEETPAEDVQDMETQVPNLEAKVPKQQRSRRTTGEHVPPAMG
ncbi:hypothetical protein KI387_012454, partial [Taxus chinensis]